MTASGSSIEASSAPSVEVAANPFRGILGLSAGDLVAKALYFLTSVYLARVLGVVEFGIWEFANSLLSYFMRAADAGLGAWGVRQVAQTGNARGLAPRVTVLRLLLAGVAFTALLPLLSWIPDRPQLRRVLVLLGLTLFPQAASLRWIVMGQQYMTRAATGSVIGQAVLAGTVVAFVRNPSDLFWVPVLKLISDSAVASYFGWLFVKEHGLPELSPRLRAAIDILGPALTLGASSVLATVNYNFDSVMLGFLKGATTVGWYSAAYKPVTVVLAMPMTYFLGLYPALASRYAKDKAEFRRIVNLSLRLSADLSIPFGVGGAMLAWPITMLLFGPEYAPSVPVLQLLVWSAVLVILRGTLRQGLIVADRAGVELRCAIASAGLNIALNIALIPTYGMMGAAAATLVSEVLWVAMVLNRLNHYVIKVGLWQYLWGPALAGTVMAACLWFTPPALWVAGAVLSVAVYFGVLFLLGGASRRDWSHILKPSHT